MIHKKDREMKEIIGKMVNLGIRQGWSTVQYSKPAVRITSELIKKLQVAGNIDANGTSISFHVKERPLRG